MSVHLARNRWPTVSFGEVVQQIKDRIDPESAAVERFVAGEHMDTDDLQVRRWGNAESVELGPAFHMRFCPGDVLYGSRRTYLRKVGVAGFEGVTANTTFVLRPSDVGMLLPDLLPFTMSATSFHEHSVRESKGSVNPYVNFSDLSWYEFALPPMEAQIELLKPLRAIEDSLDSLHILGQSLTRLLQSTTEHLLTRSGSETPLSDIARLEIDKVPVEPRTVLKSVGVRNQGQGLFEKEPVVGDKTSYKTMHRLHAGQVVMRKLTAWEGAIAIVDDEFDGHVVSAEFPTLSVDSSRALPDYLRWEFRRPHFWREMEVRCKGTARRRSRLHPDDLLNITIQLPPLPDQRKADTLLSEIDRYRDVVEGRRNELLAVRQAIVDRWLGPTNGEVDV